MYYERLESVTDGTARNPITIMGGRDAIILDSSPAVEIHHSHIHLVVSWFSCVFLRKIIGHHCCLDLKGIERSWSGPSCGKEESEI